MKHRCRPRLHQSPGTLGGTVTLKNHLNPAWNASIKAHEELMAKKAALSAASDVKHVIWLKIFYRLGLVFLCMMMVHRFFASLLKDV
jgi:hypothetical protein